MTMFQAMKIFYLVDTTNHLHLNMYSRIDGYFNDWIGLHCSIGCQYGVYRSVQSLNRSGNKFRKKMDQIDYEIKYLRLPAHLKKKIKAFYDYRYINCQTLQDRLSILNENCMSPPLRREVAIHTICHL